MQYPIFFVSVNFKSSKDGADGADIERVTLKVLRMVQMVLTLRELKWRTKVGVEWDVVWRGRSIF